MREIAYIIILFILTSYSPGKTTSDWTDHNQFFQVYRFSENVMGLTIELGFATTTENPYIDSAFDKCNRTDSIGYVIFHPIKTCTPIDASGKFRFFKNKLLDSLLLDIPEKDFFVYCTKGVVKRTIQDVVYSLEVCRSNVVVFRFASIDTSKYGQPIFCSQLKLPLTFGANNSIDNKVNKYESKLPGDFSNHLKSKTFAYSDTLFCTYSDNFKWNYSSNSDCLFPSRAIFVKSIHTDTMYIKWSGGLDLFGIPCY